MFWRKLVHVDAAPSVVQEPLVGSIAHQIEMVRFGGDPLILRRPPIGMVACTHCGQCVPAGDPQLVGWFRSPCDGAEWPSHRLCTDCQHSLVEPVTIVVDGWGDAMERQGPWYPGQEAVASQFTGASTTLLVYPPGAMHGRLALPDHRFDAGGVAYVGQDAIVYKILCI